MPRTCFPYMFFIFMTPKRAHAVSSASDSSSKERRTSVELLVRRSRVARHPEDGEPGLRELRVQLAELQALVRAAGVLSFGRSRG